MASETNPYDSLGLLPGSSLSDIKRRYRQLAKQYHPDRNRDTAAEAKLREINAAYRLLSDSRTKAEYDRAFDAIFNPPRTPVPETSFRRGSLGTAAGLALLLLLSTACGVLLRPEHGSPALSRLLASFSKPAVPERPAPSYSFVPSHGAFDDPSANGSGKVTDPAQADPNAAPQQSSF